MAIKSDPVNQDALIRTGRYTRTPYIGQHGWVSVESGKLHWDELETLIADAYESVAPKPKSAGAATSAQGAARVGKSEAVMKAAATKPGAKKSGVKKSTTKKSIARKSTAKKSASKKSPAKKSAVKKPATIKAAGKRSASKSSKKR